MKQQMTVTNVRMPTHDYALIKTLAADAGMSVNAFITTTLKDTAREQMLRSDVSKKTSKKRKQQSLYEAFIALSKMPNKPMESSEDDKIIYDL